LEGAFFFGGGFFWQKPGFPSWGPCSKTAPPPSFFPPQNKVFSPTFLLFWGFSFPLGKKLIFFPYPFGPVSCFLAVIYWTFCGYGYQTPLIFQFSESRGQPPNLFPTRFFPRLFFLVLSRFFGKLQPQGWPAWGRGLFIIFISFLGFFFQGVFPFFLLFFFTNDSHFVFLIGLVVFGAGGSLFLFPCGLSFWGVVVYPFNDRSKKTSCTSPHPLWFFTPFWGPPCCQGKVLGGFILGVAS